MARSSGKAILLGEHAVVYGVPAIAAGLELGATATATRASTSSIVLGAHASATAGDGSDLGKALSALLESLHAGPCAVSVVLDLPAGVGLGASAAIAVAVARAALEVAGDDAPDVARVAESAMAWERVFHGNPSGVDAWAAAHGGCMTFVRGKGVTPLYVARALPLAVGIAGPAASTKVMVEGLARLRDRKPEMVQKSFDGIESLVKNAALCIGAGDLPGLGKLLDLNQMILSGLFLSTEEIERACGIARDAGALGAKLTGSGGGGCVIALGDGDATPILTAWKKDGIEGFATTVRASPGERERAVTIAIAHANIALAKYWGKADLGKNLPAVPSLSLTLDALRTRTDVTLAPHLAEDEVSLDGRPAKDKERKRVVAMLDEIRATAGTAARASVKSENSFPTAAGLASSASGFAALALAATRAFGLSESRDALSARARRASVSAARSLHGGFVVLPARGEHAEPLAKGDHFPLAMVVALTRAGEKPVGSTEE